MAAKFIGGGCSWRRFSRNLDKRTASSRVLLFSVRSSHSMDDMDTVYKQLGERNRFANRIKALNRLKAKLLVIAKEQKVSDVYKISKNIAEPWRVEETRRYVKGQKMVVDLKTGLEILDLKSVLDGNIGPLLGAHIGMRRSIDAI
ncbi:hypothetical protein F2Q68_00041673 [Brassica cretica]|uniref:Uncharacterized protein n=1 Tax=Brassica cretica TaxID=69181 RepID=A0A8S9MCF7_BRACR|nr:hypothetical protein F2Q68_00041673 [Brassica cretica]